MSLRSRIEAMWYSSRAPLWLVPLSFLYGFVMSVRGLLYRIGLRHRVKVGVPVIVIGNLTVGGTGKTPLVAWLASKLAAVGHRVAIVSRGYGGRARGVTRVTLHSRASEVGDEPLLLARRAQATVFIGRDRVAAARAAVADGADVVISDDGLQHLALVRHCEIVVIDGLRGFGNGCLLPRGPLRESPRRLRRVNAVIINGATSPAARAIARIRPVRIDGMTLGSTTRSVVSNFVAPSASEASRMPPGMAAKPSSVATMTTGTVSSASVREAQKMPPVPKVGVGSASGKKRRSMLPPTK